MKLPFKSISALIDYDATSPMDSGEFDDNLWILLCKKIGSPKDLEAFRHPVAVYYASRLLEWEVGNGGFAQAVYNIPDWFEYAAIGYAALGKRKAVQLIRDALALLKGEREDLKEKRLLDGTTIGELFAHFSESRMIELDKRIPEDEWWIDDERIEYVRKNKDAFREVQ